MVYWVDERTSEATWKSRGFESEIDSTLGPNSEASALRQVSEDAPGLLGSCERAGFDALRHAR